MGPDALSSIADGVKLPPNDHVQAAAASACEPAAPALPTLKPSTLDIPEPIAQLHEIVEMQPIEGFVLAKGISREEGRRHENPVVPCSRSRTVFN